MSESIIYIVIIAASILVVLAASFFSGRENSSWKKEIRERIKSLNSKAFSKNEDSVRRSIIEIDKTLDTILKNRKVSGKSLGERLKSSENLFRNRDQYNKTWESHKVRNKLVHDFGFNPKINTLQKHYKSLREVCLYLIK